MQITTKTLLQAAGILAALSTIGGFTIGFASVAKPILDSGPLPVPSRAEMNVQVAGLTATIQGIQQQNARQAREDAARDKLLAATRQQVLESLLSGAQNDFRHSPNVSTKTYMCSLINQIDRLRAVNQLPPLPPC